MKSSECGLRVEKEPSPENEGKCRRHEELVDHGNKLEPPVVDSVCQKEKSQILDCLLLLVAAASCPRSRLDHQLALSVQRLCLKRNPRPQVFYALVFGLHRRHISG
jgi:hypothetical protein